MRAIEHADWPSIAATALAENPDAAPSVAAFTETWEDPAALGIAVGLLACDHRAVADCGEQILLRFASRLLPSSPADLPRKINEALTPGPVPPPASLVDALIRALEATAAHERSSPALCALLLLDRPAFDEARADLAPLLTIAMDDAHPAFPTIRRLLRRDDSPAMRRIAWRLLGDHPLGIAALERVARSGSPAQHNAVLEHTHLLQNPTRARMAARLATSQGPRPAGKPNGLQPARDSALPPSAAGLSVRARRGLPRLLASAHASADLAAALHVESLTDPDAHTRLAHARHAEGFELVDYCLDPSPAIAHAAMLRWSTVGIGSTRDLTASPSEHRTHIAAKLVRSPHEAVRRVARDEPAADATAGTLLAGRARLLAALRHDRASLAATLRDAAAHGKTGDRLEAIRVARRLGVLDGWLDLLAGMIDTPSVDARLAATAAAALGEFAETEATGALASALSHPDPRVQANAIEALDLFHRRRAAAIPDHRLVEFKTAREHRARANAIRAIARDPEGRPDPRASADDLSAMLADDRPPHRLAGVWLAERTLCGTRERGEVWQDLARRVAALARYEADAHVKARAVRCARRLLAEVASPPRAAARTDPAVAHARDRLDRFAASYAGGAA
ncbi:MAG: HEAT repeat domain-containing protein [Phycisphaeraceae bacterium]|nr:MAG: HEAT repeat domain-containing protein [Phycisphaeraceae bacterium]